jgi:hypothetical protein
MNLYMEKVYKLWEDFPLNFQRALLLAYFRSPCLCICLPLLWILNTWTNFYVTWYVHHGTSVHLNGVLNKSLPSVCVTVCVSSLSLLGNGSVNTFPQRRIHATIEELSDASFSMRCLPYQRRFCVSAFPPIVAKQRPGKHIPAARKDCWRRRFLGRPRRIKRNQDIGSS